MPIKINALANNEAEILIHEAIGEDFFGGGLTSKQFAEDLARHSSAALLTVRINSNGGSCTDGIAIYNALRTHGARIVVIVEGIAASIASVIAMAGDVRRFAEGALMMIHSPWAIVANNAEGLRQFADVLDKHEDSLLDIYASRTGTPRDRLRAMLRDETWMNGKEALALGFATEVAETSSLAAASAATNLATHRERFAAFASTHLTRFPTMPQPATDEPNRASILAQETRRRNEVKAIFAGRLAKQFPDLLASCLDDVDCTAAAASQQLLAKLGEGAEPLRGGYSQASPAPSDFHAAATDAILIRAGIAVDNPSPAARDLRNTSIIEIARSALSQTGRSHRNLTPTQVIKAALSTSDFPGILENALGKVLRAGYENDPQSHVAWTKRTMVPDFKTQSRLLLGSAPGLLEIAELGEYHYGSLSENKATLEISKFGRAIKMSWEMLINDDLQAFMSVPQSMGAAARRKEADDVYALFTANSGNGQTMQDTVALFHSASHGNVSASVGAISVTTLGAARSLLRKQTALGNGGYLNLNPRFLIVPSESETLAEQVLAAATRHVSDTIATNTKSAQAVTPEWISKLQLVVEPRLNAAYGFYVAAHHSQIDTCELATLEPDGGAPVLEEEREFNVDAQAYKVRHSFVAKFIDWKGIVRVPVS